MPEMNHESILHDRVLEVVAEVTSFQVLDQNWVTTAQVTAEYVRRHGRVPSATVVTVLYDLLSHGKVRKQIRPIGKSSGITVWRLS